MMRGGAKSWGFLSILTDVMVVTSLTHHFQFEFEFDWLLNVTCNDISVIYVTAHRCAGGIKKNLDLRSGFQGHRHFVGFFSVPVQAQTQGHPFYGYSENLPHLVAFYDTLGIRRTYSRLKPPRGPITFKDHT